MDTTIRILADSGYCAVIPTYNNARTIVDVVRRTLRLVETVIVVDDGCTDETPALLKAEGVVVVSHGHNRGKGVALRTGFRKAYELGYTHAITIDSDGQHYPEEMPRIVTASRAEPDAIIIGLRDMTGRDVPSISTFGRMFSNFWLRLATGIEAEDTQSGFRVYPLRHVTRISCLSRRFTYECELLARAAWGGCPIRAVPVRVYYPPKEERVSHFNPVWDNVRYFFLYNYLNFRRLLVPIPARRLVPRRPLWDGTVFGTLRNALSRLRRTADLPDSAQLTGGPIARFRQLVRHLVHEHDSPGNLGMAVAIGAFIGATPLIGVHWLLALYAATRMHLNRIACVAATNVSFGPLTALLAIASIALGKLMTGSSFALPYTWNATTLLAFGRANLAHWALGSSVIGLVLAFVLGLGTLYGVRALRRARTHARPEPEPAETPAPPEPANRSVPVLSAAHTP